jgi:ABC-type Mn2+/Zn2+ transport system ATPase subunit
MIKVHNLSFARGGKTIFANFNFSVSGTGATLLSGPNGSGKTTLLNLMGGILKPTLGTITINDQAIADLSARKQSRLRSVAPQRRIFDLAFRVEDVLKIIPSKSRSSHTERVIEELELTDLLMKKITELSLGQQQRVSVALALIQNSDFYLLDEPFSAQDTHFTKKLLNLIGEIKAHKGVFVISHNTDLLRSYFDTFTSL